MSLDHNNNDSVGRIRVLLHGCNGHMGRTVSDIIDADDALEIVAGVDPYTGVDNKYPVFAAIDECEVEADVVIDFSSASAVDGLLSYCESKGLPVVLCSTGLSEEQLDRMNEISQNTAVLRSGNMSLGINTLCDVLEKVSKIFTEAGFDVEVVEKHHRRKLDAPSGTAIMLADAVNDSAGGDYEYVYDRSDRRLARPKKEIGISAIRGGTIVGDHDVIFAGEDEVITFSHRSYSRNVFAKGAVEAAKFLAGKKSGMYDMRDVIATD